MGRGGNTMLEAGRERVGASKLKSQCNIEAKAQMEQPPSKLLWTAMLDNVICCFILQE